MENIRIPISFVVEMDDVGWDNGRDLRLKGQASRSGIPRNHAVEDYEVLKQISDATGKNLVCALCLGDWDKDNLLRGEVGITHDPFGWDRASTIDLEKMQRCIEILESAEHIEYMLHGLLHGVYDEDGKQITEHDFYIRRILPNGTSEPLVTSRDDFCRRIELFFKIYNSWGFKKPVRSFVVPNGISGMSDATVEKTAKILSEYGIKYWTDSFTFPETVKVINGVACFKWGRGGGVIPWNAYDFDPAKLGAFVTYEDEKNSCLRGSHWANFLRFNPKKNHLNVPRWEEYYNRQSEYFGTALANTLEEAVNQLFHHEYTKINKCKDGYIFDFSEVHRNGFSKLKSELFLSFKNGTEPSYALGAEISLLEVHRDFSTYKITYAGTRVTIFTK